MSQGLTLESWLSFQEKIFLPNKSILHVFRGVINTPIAHLCDRYFVMLDQDDYVLVSYTYSMPDSNCNHNSFSCIRRTIAFQKFQEPINYSRKKMAFEISHIIDSHIICHSWLWCQLWSHGYWPLTLPNLQKKINIKGWTLHFRHGLLLHSITQIISPQKHI